MKLLKLMRRNLLRRPARTLFTIFGIASALFLFVGIESLSHGFNEALGSGRAQTTLIVFRENRYCPQTSFLPIRYAAKIEEIKGVETVLPVRVFLNNCRASLDMISFQGTPVDTLLDAREINLIEGDLGQFRSEKDSALVGKTFAERRGLSVGEKFVFGEIAVKIVGIFESSLPMEENNILTHLEFLQRAGPVNKLGTVTQFEVKVKTADDAKRVAKEIDALFATAEEPTDTHSQLAFVENATRDLRDLLSFGRVFGVACVLVILILVGNTVMMSVGERVREFGLLRTLGFHGRHLMFIVLGESILIALLGAGIGVGGAIGAISAGDLALGVEGVQITFSTAPTVILKGVMTAVVLSMLVSIIPAWRVAVRPVVRALRGT